MKYLVSSCLAGVACRYNGTASLDEKIQELVEQEQAKMVCPELLGGFSTPREPAEIVGGTGADVLAGRAKVIEQGGADVTDLYIKGAYQTLEWARKLGVSCVVLKEFSPSCGTKMIYDGHFANQKVAGEGVTAALLRQEGYRVISEHELMEQLQQL
ncbi:DUF523 domain-containing protein [Paenibacillus barcinonensis]|uniref:DUF523 domain-containing protein n=1 Tax=Paenibacillus barcinonensis TaxID=198119 RepID=A0A2V4VC07_PAEBA|nr:DUF523 domain-containing protein [Paenibacillus barcinonensis]PYE42400.1 uncharacterized protein YbbK (DUF523 family) [Paenibacillus barcinonensis]QKS58355.1 DUF523 domain-containing protein [Paenibacillus barcinonensis]